MNALPNPFDTAATPVAVVEAAASPSLAGKDDAAADYTPEPFSEYARRRCMPIISPPLPKPERDIDSIALTAVSKALNLHPRDLDLDPPPLFLRSPSQAFIRALFSIAGH